MNSAIKKIFARNYSPNCIHCTVGPATIIYSIFGGFSSTYQCAHLKPSTVASHFKINQFLYLSGILITLFNITSCFFYLNAIIFNEHNKLILLVLLSELLHTANAIVLNLCNLFSCKKYVKQLNVLVDVWKTYNLTFKFDEIRKAKYMGYCYCLGVVGFRVFFHVRDYYLTNQLDELTNLVTKCSSTIVSMLISTGSAVFNLEVTAFRVSIEQSQRNLEKEMLRNETSLLEALVKFGRLHLAFMQNFSCFVKLTAPYFLFWMSLFLMELIVNVYGYLYMLTQQECNSDLLILGIRSIIIWFTMMYMLLNFENLTNVSNDLLSFLFKCRISTLSAQEADQVEMIINMLVIQKPVLKACDIFTVGIRLLASISGTVVTYVLVALQFREARPR